MTRVSALAGTWYDADARRLAADLDGWLDAANRAVDARIRALLLPHAGYRWSGRVAASAVAAVRGRSFRRVVVLGPSHRVRLPNVIALPTDEELATPLGSLSLDAAALDALEGPGFERLPGVHDAEHSVEIELPLLQRALPRFHLVPLVVGDLETEAATRAARRLVEIVDDDTLLVVSSDFTHYGRQFGYVPFTGDVPEAIERLDLDAFAHIRAVDPDGFAAYVRRTGATICGRRPIEVLLRMLPPEAQVALEAYDRSGALTGSWDHSVSYVGATFRFDAWPPSAAASQAARVAGDAAGLPDLARRAIRHRVATGDEPEAATLGIDVTGALALPAAVFVTLRREGRLRGCIGQVRARHPLWRAVVRAAVAAASEDLRFPPVCDDEVDALEIKVSVLTPPREVASWREIACGRHGVILRHGPHAATFLPEVAGDQGWDRETLLDHLARKAGLAPDAWRDPEARFEVFTSETFESGPAH